jgi:hypothetical protein
VVLIGFIEGYILLPFGFAAFVGTVFPTAFMVWVLREVVTVIDRADYRLQTIRRVIPLSRQIVLSGKDREVTARLLANMMATCDSLLAWKTAERARQLG